MYIKCVIWMVNGKDQSVLVIEYFLTCTTQIIISQAV